MANYIPRKEYTDPVQYAAKTAVQYDHYILSKVNEFLVAEERLLYHLRRRRKWDYKRYY